MDCKELQKKKSNVLQLSLLFSVFTSHVIKTKNRDRSMNLFKNLGYTIDN